MLMEKNIKNAKFVLSKDEIGYEEVLDDFNNSDEIYILTFNISADKEDLLKRLKNLDSKTQVHIITNIPQRYEKYFSDYARDNARKKITVYINKLSPSNFQAQIIPFFNFNNHAKIIATNNMAYIGSANFSDESKKNFESGFIVKDKDFLSFLQDKVFPEIIKFSEPYYEDEFMELKIFVANIFSRLSQLTDKLEYEFYDDDDKIGRVYRIEGDFNVDIADLEDLEGTLLELKDIITMIDDKSLKEPQIAKLKDIIDQSKIDNLLKLTDENNIIEACKFDQQKFCENYLEEHALEADEEHLDECIDKGNEKAFEIFDEIASRAEDDINKLMELSKALNEEISNLVEELHKISNVNEKVDNTHP